MPSIIVNGQTIFYAYGNRASEPSPPLLLIHGAGGTQLYWPPHLRRLPNTLIYAPDLPGHGRSTGDGCTSIPAYREWLHNFVDALNLPPFVLAGHSMGGAIALDFALAYPERLVGLGLVGTSSRLRVAPAILQGIQSDFTATTQQLIELMYSPAANPQTKRIALQRLRAVEPAVLHGDFSACDAFDVGARVAEITLPTLIACGQLDKMTPVKYSERLHEQLRNSELHLLANAGHMVMLEQADEMTQLFVNFLARISVAQVAREKEQRP
jgi:pimeloyl-ACP methyl ester carboxylesterase